MFEELGNALRPVVNTLRSLYSKTIALEEAQAAGGSGYTSVGKNMIMPSTPLEFASVDLTGQGAVTPVAATNLLDLSGFETVTVLWDGTKYECAISYGMMFGNVSLSPSAGEDTGEPFVFINDADSASGLFLATTEGKHTVSVYKQTETIHPIDPKFLPYTTVGEDVWGLSIATVSATAFQQQNLVYSENFDTITGLDDVDRTPAEIAELCKNADKIKYLFGEGVFVECAIGIKQYNENSLGQIGFTATLYVDAVDARVTCNCTIAFTDVVSIFVAVNPIA